MDEFDNLAGSTVFVDQDNNDYEDAPSSSLSFEISDQESPWLDKTLKMSSRDSIHEENEIGILQMIILKLNNKKF